MDYNHKKILVIHPADPSTEFLSVIYKDMNAMVIRQPIPKSQLKRLMKDADKIIMLGHGTETGMGFVKYSNGYPMHITPIVDSTLVYLLREKDENVFIWCNADKFVKKYNLVGFSTGMFISELDEADMFNVKATADEIYESNDRFARIVRNYIHKSTDELKTIVREDYSIDSDVARYNNHRIYNFKKQ